MLHKITIKKTELEPTLTIIRALINTHIPKPWDQYISHGGTGDTVQEGFLAYGLNWNETEAGQDAPDITPFWDAIARIYKIEDDGSFPWCDACQSWHHLKNPTCIKLKTKRVTVKNTDGEILATFYGTVERIRETNGVTIEVD